MSPILPDFSDFDDNCILGHHFSGALPIIEMIIENVSTTNVIYIYYWRKHITLKKPFNQDLSICEKLVNFTKYDDAIEEMMTVLKFWWSNYIHFMTV